MTVAQTAMPSDVSQGEWVAEPANGKVRAVGIPDSDRHIAVAIHLSPFAAVFFQLAIFAPLVLWLVSKDKSAFADDHGREIMNFGISFLLLHILLGITVIGLILIPVLWIVGLVSLVRGAVAAGRGELFRYPMTFRFLS
jgi:uncharacterized Tic20 family protein